jgi:hypothetical protein
LSFVRGELYSLRREIASKFQEDVDLYGFDWNKSMPSNLKTVLGELALTLKARKIPRLSGLKGFGYNFSNYCGASQEKLTPYSKNKFAIVIENSLELRTEKLYDSVEAGAIPLYVGPKVPEDIPENLFIHCEPNVDSIRRGMDSVKMIDIETWLSNRKAWMATSNYLDNSKTRYFRFLDNLFLGNINKITSPIHQAKKWQKLT